MSDATATVVETPAKTGEMRAEAPKHSVEAALESNDTSGVYRIARDQVDETVTRELGISKVDDVNAATVAGPEIIALRQADSEFQQKVDGALGGLKTTLDVVTKPAPVAKVEVPVAKVEPGAEVEAPVAPVVVETKPEELKQPEPGSPEADEDATLLASEDAFEQRRASIARQKANIADLQKKIEDLESEPKSSSQRKTLEAYRAGQLASQADLDLMNAVEGIALAKKAGNTAAQLEYEKQIPILHENHKKAYALSTEAFRNSAIAYGKGAEFDAREKKNEAEHKLNQELPAPHPDAPLTLTEETEQGEVTVTELKGTEADQVKSEILSAELAPETFARLETVRKDLATEELALHEFVNTHGKAHTPLEQAYLDALKERVTALEFEKQTHETGDKSYEATAKLVELKQKAEKAESAYQKMYDGYMNQPIEPHPEKKAPEQTVVATPAKEGLRLDEEDEDYEARQYEQYHPGNSFGQERSAPTKARPVVEGSPMGTPPKPKGRMGKLIDSLKFWNYLSGKQK